MALSRARFGLGALRAMAALALGGALLGGPVVASAASLQSASFDQAVPLTGDMDGHLVSGPGGHFAYYRFFYPADGSTATVNVEVAPDDPTILQNVGIKIYGPTPGKEYFTGGDQPGIVPNVSGAVTSTDPNDRGQYTVQVYDYDPNPTGAIDFHIWPTGLVPQPGLVAAPAAPAALEPAPQVAPLPVAPAPIAAPAPSAAPAGANTPGPSADQATPLVGTQTGTLAANPAGSFAYYSFDYPGDESVYTLNLEVSTNDPAVLANVGFHVYGPLPNNVYVTGGVEPGADPNVSGNLITTDKGHFVVQVYNYDPANTLGYALSLVQAPPPSELQHS